MDRRARLRRPLRLALIAALAVGLAGCAPQAATTPSETATPSPAPVSSTTIAPTSTAPAPTATASASTSPAPESAASDGPDRTGGEGCALAVTITPQPKMSGAGQSYSQVDVVNAGERACELPSGFALELVDASGRRSGKVPSLARTLELAPSEAHAELLHLSAAGAWSCPGLTATTVTVTAEGADASRTSVAGLPRNEFCEGYADRQLSLEPID